MGNTTPIAERSYQELQKLYTEIFGKKSVGIKKTVLIKEIEEFDNKTDEKIPTTNEDIISKNDNTNNGDDGDLPSNENDAKNNKELSESAEKILTQRKKGRIINCQKTGKEIFPTEDYDIEDGLILKILT